MEYLSKVDRFKAGLKPDVKSTIIHGMFEHSNSASNERPLTTNRNQLPSDDIRTSQGFHTRKERSEGDGILRQCSTACDRSGELLFDESKAVVVTDKLTACALNDLFTDKTCVLLVRNYASSIVCQQLDGFLKEKASDPYTHEIRTDGVAELIYYGVNRYGFPLNTSYTDDTGENLEKYLSEALPTIRCLRKAAEPFLSPIDKFRAEMDETWPKNVNIATLRGQKTFCGIGRVMPFDLSELSETQPHFDAVPSSYFPNIHKQFTANFYLNVPDQGGELEIWNVTPIDIDNVENFTIPEDWRAELPKSIKVKPESGDLVLFNTRRPHAITKFRGPNPRTSIQTFIGLTKDMEIFLWV